ANIGTAGGPVPIASPIVTLNTKNATTTNGNIYASDTVAANLSDSTINGTTYTNTGLNNFCFTDSAAGGIDTSAGFGTITSGTVALSASAGSIGISTSSPATISAANLSANASGSVFVSDTATGTVTIGTCATCSISSGANTTSGTFYVTAPNASS